METTITATLEVSSTAFWPEGWIPTHYTCDGDNVNPPLTIQKIPAGTQSLVLWVEDPDANETWFHWLVWNIPPRKEIEEDSIPGVEGYNSFRQHNYGGPCPPSGTHRYFFKIFALDCTLELRRSAKHHELLEAMKGHVLAEGELVGLYKR